MQKAVYAGSFDPPTNGHMWMIQKGVELFGEMVVAIGVNPEKKSTFPIDERLEMLRKSTRGIQGAEITSFENLYLVDYADRIGAGYMLRGIRNEGDFQYERDMNRINRENNPHIETIYLFPPKEISEVSSSGVRGLVGPEGWEKMIEKYVPRHVYNKMLGKFRGHSARFAEVWERMGAKGDPQKVYGMLAQMYSENFRDYHNLVHIAHGLRELEEGKRLADNADDVEMAFWFHDSVYNPHKTDNEEKSAELAYNALVGAGIEPHRSDKIRNLILATNHGSFPARIAGGMDVKLLKDTDLAILGKPPEEFAQGGDDIRWEYSGIPEGAFLRGRTAVFKSFLAQPKIYSTEFFRKKYEKQARKNMSAWIEGNKGKFLEE